MFTALLPKGAPFFELLLQQNALLCTVAIKVAEIFEGQVDMERQRQEIISLEDEADRIYLAITKHLSQTFITPIDREDILHINKAQEDSIDLFHNLVNRFSLLELKQIRFPMLRISCLLKNMVHHLCF